MADIKPICAWRYNDALTANIDKLTAPLFDVVSDKQREKLYTHPYNSIHLSVPKGDQPILQAQQLLDKWKKNGIIKQDPIPGIYVYYQYFKLSGSTTEYCRKGFICHIRVYDWSEGTILRHENTIPRAVNDRVELLEKTNLHTSPTHGLYTDTDFVLEKYMDEAMRSPLYETEDYQGVRDVLAVIQDARIIKLFVKTLINKKIILADGHHRYESSLLLKQKKQKNNPLHNGNEAYNFHLMYLTNTEAGNLAILPTHRLIAGIESFQEDDIIEKLSHYFDIQIIENPDTLNEIIVGKKWTFGVVFKNQSLKIKLKPDAINQITWNFPAEILNLDLTVLHYFIIEKIFNIPGKTQRHATQISFERIFTTCLSNVYQGKSQMAIITREVSIDEIKQVCNSKYTMPQKSTYFYPKVVGGFLFSSILESEFHLPSFAPF